MYVLTDFGAARELPEDETFMSIYGTEEYIVSITIASVHFKVEYMSRSMGKCTSCQSYPCEIRIACTSAPSYQNI